MLEFDGDGLVATNITHDNVSVEGASDSMDPPLSFDTMSGFVTRFDDFYDDNNYMSIFKYLLVSHHFPLIAPPAPAAHVCDVNDMGDTDDPLVVSHSLILIQMIGKLHPFLIAQS